MKEQIKELIHHHKEARQEVFSLLEELSRIDDSKLSHKEKDILIESKIKLSEEYDMRGLFITDLKNLI